MQSRNKTSLVLVFVLFCAIGLLVMCVDRSLERELDLRLDEQFAHDARLFHQDLHKAAIIRWIFFAGLVFAGMRFASHALEKTIEKGRSQLQDEMELRRKAERGMFEAGPGMIFRWRAEPGWPVESVSDNVASILGYTAEELTAGCSSYRALIYSEDRDRVEREVSEAAKGAAERMVHEPYRLVRKDGKVVWVADYTSIVRDDSGVIGHYHGYVIDISARMQAVSALRESEELFRSLAEHAPSGIFLVDDQYQFVYLNEQFSRILGYDHDEIMGKDFRTVIAEESRQMVDERYRKRRLGEAVGDRYEIIAIAKGGGRRILELAASIVKDAEGNILTLGQVMDITDRKQAEEKKKRRERLIIAQNEAALACMSTTDPFLCCRAIVNRIGPAIGASRAYVFLDRRDPDGRLLTSQMAEWCAQGVTPQIDNPCLQDLPYEEDFPRWVKAFSQGESISGMVRDFPRSEREVLEPQEIKAILVVPIPGGRSHLGFIGFDNCISEREWSTEEESLLRGAANTLSETLRRIENESRNIRLAQAIEQAEEAVVITDAKGTIAFVNPCFERMTGYKREEAMGRDPSMFKGGAHDEVFYKNLWETITAGRTWEGRLINRKKDGTPVTEQAVISPIKDETGRITGFVKVSRDIGRELALEGQLRQAQKMEAVGQLAGGVAHDFNNILQVINGYTSLALTRLPDGSPVRTMLDHVAKAGDRAAGLVSQILAFSRRQILQSMDVDLNEVTSNVTSMLERIIGEHIELDFIPGRRLGIVHADRSMMEQVIMNLCVNARDAMPDGGRLTLETENVTVNGEYCKDHPWAKPGRYVLLAVTDTGCGMDAETLDHIFEPFFTTKGTGQGTGLGLAMVYGIVKQHEGMIHVYSEPGKGTTFKIYLPVSGRRAAEVGTKIEGPVTGGAETILVAEDDELVRELAREILEAEGYTVMTARDGLEAVSIFKKNDTNIDLVVLDVMMPKMDGRRVYKRIRKIRPGLPVLFASGYSQNAIHTNFVLNEGVALISKPFSRGDFLRAVRNVLNGVS